MGTKRGWQSMCCWLIHSSPSSESPSIVAATCESVTVMTSCSCPATGSSSSFWTSSCWLWLALSSGRNGQGPAWLSASADCATAHSLCDNLGSRQAAVRSPGLQETRHILSAVTSLPQSAPQNTASGCTETFGEAGVGTVVHTVNWFPREAEGEVLLCGVTAASYNVEPFSWACALSFSLWSFV